ncbi:probable inactive 1-aminocyclopropane-1-carboxylate synthase-like protein 2 [Phoca vitulina]|uniref:probable inactive 1-aminocyclopropane-1-carboxylate synthase-like protein 2 n=1 Tax=Phoca vitulina TaxID=9720 RepID=UPI0013960C5A|nr:probable inactive 1-aminocyclopropane-1-carboxylate synthase-like protein 2 [Phoca vitulina]
MSHQSDTLHLPCGQMRGQGLGSQGTRTQPMEMMHLQQTIEKHIMQLAARHQQQDLVLGDQRHHQATGEQEALLGNLMSQLVNLLQSGTTGGLGLQPSCPSLDVRGDVGGGQGAQSAGQPDQPVHQVKDPEATFVSQHLCNRGIVTSASYWASFQDYKMYQGDKYHEDKNPLGFINLGISENKLCLDLMTERLSQSDMNFTEDVLLQYPDWSGQPFLREEVARFLTYYCKVPAQLDPENVVVLNGCSSVFSTLAMVLCDPGEALLTPTPFYGGFVFSSHLYSKVELILVHLDSEGKKVRGLVLINPQNPLGDVYSRDSLKEYLEFAKTYNLHVIIDEIYMLSVFDESITFHSILSMESLPDPNRTHVVWGTSKDFGISGFRFGVLDTHNKEVASAVSSFGYLHSVSGIAQYKLCRLLRDREWIDGVYLPTYHSRLQRAHRYITKKLKALGIPFLNRGSGLYIWINLKVYLDPCTFEEELLLCRRFLDNKLILSRGKTYMCKEAGWFRMVFADRPLRLKQAIYRFYQVLEEQKRDLRVKQLESAQRE